MRHARYHKRHETTECRGAQAEAVTGLPRACESWRGIMSWFFLTGVLGYLLVRMVLWVRGQVRHALWVGGMPVPIVHAVAVPEHLTGGLRLLFDQCVATRRALHASQTTIARLQILDPDVPLGCIRDFRYRVAISEAWRASRAVLVAVDDLGVDEQVRLGGAGFAPVQLDHHHQVLRRIAAVTVRARALEPFTLAAVAHARTTLTELALAVEQIEQALARVPGDPYRHVA